MTAIYLKYKNVFNGGTVDFELYQKAETMIK